jgi:type I restriction enzyme M protein
MITGELRSKVDKLWTTFWNNGISNPLSVIEQISYLLFIKRLDDLELTKEKKANRTKKPIESPFFSDETQSCRWSKFKHLPAEEMLKVVRDEAFPLIKNLGNDAQTAYSRHMKDAVFMITSPALLENVVSQIDNIPMEDRDTKGDLYEYMLSKLTTAGTNGQFRTPRHIIKMMVELMSPSPHDVVCDPACGTAGFLVATAEYLQGLEDENGRVLNVPENRKHFNESMFHGFDFDATMLRIGSMNLMLHGIENPSIEARDSLSEDHSNVDEQFTLILANPPFKGSIAKDSIAKDLTKVIKTTKTELLFLALFLRLLKTGGRAAVIVPDGVLFGSSKAHKTIRKELVESHKLDGVISMPSGVFKPYAGVSTAILMFTKTGAGGTDKVWFYDMENDGLSLDDKRQAIESNDIPDIIKSFQLSVISHQSSVISHQLSVISHQSSVNSHQLSVISHQSSVNSEQLSLFDDRKGKCFFVGKDEIVKNGYDLSINRYKEIEYEEVEYEAPKVIIDKLKGLENEINQDLQLLEGLLK